MNILILLPDDEEKDILLTAPPYTMRLGTDKEIQIIPSTPHGQILDFPIYHVRTENGELMAVSEFNVVDEKRKERKFYATGIMIGMMK